MAYPTSVATDADLHLAKNNLSTTLAGAIDSTTTTVVLTDASSFPSAGFVTIESEIIQYTGISVNTLTGVTRGADGTPQAAHADLLPVNHFIVAAHHNVLKDELIAVETELLAHFDLTGATTTIVKNGQFQAITGSAANPSWTFQGALTVGVFNGGTNILSFVTNSLERVTLDAAGKLGIGDTTPARKLSVVGGDAATGGVHNEYSIVLNTSTDTDLFSAVTGAIFAVREQSSGGIALCIYDNTSTPVIISQVGTTVFVTGAPAGGQIQLKNITGDTGVAALAGDGTVLNVSVNLIAADLT